MTYAQHPDNKYQHAPELTPTKRYNLRYLIDFKDLFAFFSQDHLVSHDSFWMHFAKLPQMLD